MSIEGFLLGAHLKSLGLWSLLGLMSRCQKMMASGVLKSKIHKEITLDEIADSIPEYKASMSLGKYIVFPNKQK